MLLLLFKIGTEQYGIEATQVIEIWPMLPIKPLYKTPDYIAGLVNFRKQLVPIIDISKLYVNKTASSRISTRIILVKISGSNNKNYTLGIIAEHVTDTINIETQTTASIGTKSKNGRLLGLELLAGDLMIHKIDVNKLLPKDLYEQVFWHKNHSDE